METVNQPKYPSPINFVSKNRAVSRPGLYLILPPENRCLSFNPTLVGCDEEVFITPKYGAGYTISKVIMGASGKSEEAYDNEFEHFYFVLNGSIRIQLDNIKREVTKGEYVWIPPSISYKIESSNNSASEFLWFRRKYQNIKIEDIPKPIFGDEKAVKAIPEVDLNPEKQLLPYTNPGFDMAFNMILVQPGAYYGLVEAHAWEHAMYILEGEGILYLNGDYHHVKEGDFIYIAPFCPEWFVAIGMEITQVRFLLYWDCNRDYAKSK